MEFEVNTYVGVSKSDPEGEKYKNDLFLYSGHNKKSPFLPDTYLLLEEIQDRVDGNNMERLRMDRAVYQSGESPMCMYNGKAEVDPQGYRKFNSVFDMKPTKNHTEALKLLGSAGSFKMQTEDASEVLRNTFKVYFQFLQGERTPCSLLFGVSKSQRRDLATSARFHWLQLGCALPILGSNVAG